MRIVARVSNVKLRQTIKKRWKSVWKMETVAPELFVPRMAHLISNKVRDLCRTLTYSAERSNLSRKRTGPGLWSIKLTRAPLHGSSYLVQYSIGTWGTLLCLYASKNKRTWPPIRARRLAVGIVFSHLSNTTADTQRLFANMAPEPLGSTSSPSIGSDLSPFLR
jgi:hypothetical protein